MIASFGPSSYVLTLNGKKTPSSEEKERSYYLKESTVGGAFCRSLRLPGVVESNLLEATVKDGVLTFVMTRKTGAQPTKIEVKE